MEQIPFLAVLAFGVLTSFGHCIGMCGGVVVAYTATKCKANCSRSSVAHLFYSLGRTTTYVMIGVLAAILGHVFSFSHITKAIFMMILAFIMILMALSLLGKIRLFHLATTGSVGQQSWFKNSFAKLIRSHSIFSFYGIGVLNGLLPCAPVYVAVAMALATGSIAGSAITMTIYGLATMPSLFILGNMVGFMKEASHRDLFVKLAAITVILFAFFTLFRALKMISA